MKNKSKKTETAVLYIRTASQDKGKITRSFFSQKDRLISYCEENEITVINIYQESAPARTLERVELKKMLEEIRTKKIRPDQILITSIDRLTRNSADAISLLQQLEKLGVRINSIDGGFQIKSAADLQMELGNKFNSIQSVFVDNNINRRPKITESIRAAKEVGRWIGPAPFGYKNAIEEIKVKTIVPDKNAEKIKWLFEEFSTGNYTIDEISRKYNDAPPMISRDKVLRILRNPVYIGKIVINNGSIEERVAGIHTSIISEALFKIVQEILDKLNESNI